jgi:hypothetical protein
MYCRGSDLGDMIDGCAVSVGVILGNDVTI